MRLARSAWIAFKWCLIFLVPALALPIIVHGGWVFGREPRYFVQTAAAGLLLGGATGTWRAHRAGAGHLPVAGALGVSAALPVAIFASQAISLGALLVVNPVRDMTSDRREPAPEFDRERRPMPRFPLQVSSDGRYLEDSTDKPFYFVGDTHWPLFWHYSLEDAERIIDDRAEKGFTSLLVSVAPFEDHRNTEGRRAFVDRRTLKPDEAYFEHADAVLDYVASKGMAAYAVVLWWGNFHREVNAEAVESYGRWLGERWKDRDNLIWVLGGDKPRPAGDRMRFRALARGFRDGGAKQIMSWHPFGGVPWLSSGHSSSEYLNTEDWLDFSSVQAHAFGGRMASRVLQDYQRSPARPTVLIEQWYFGTKLRDPGPGYPVHQPGVRVRQGHYQARIGGGSFGEGYGAWPFWYHSSSRTEWSEALEAQPIAVQIGMHMPRFFEALPWWTLRPDREGMILKRGAGRSWSWDRAVAAGNPERSVAVVYIPSRRSVDVDLGWFARPVEARWYDPTDGSYSSAGSHQNRSIRTFETPARNADGDGDFVLVLQSGE